MARTHQSATFHRLPPREVILKHIEQQEERIAGPVSYLLHIMPVVDRFGEQVYDVAAKSLQESGVVVTAERLRQVAAELRTPEGQERYADEKWGHIGSITPVQHGTVQR
jgi:hypothetical protein